MSTDKDYFLVSVDYFKAMVGLSPVEIRIFMHMTDRMDSKNVFSENKTKIRKAVSASARAVCKAIDKLESLGHIRAVGEDKWMINPRYAINCDEDLYESLLEEFNKIPVPEN